MAGLEPGLSISGETMHKTAIFLGPTLDQTIARLILEAEYLPPVKRGDLARLNSEISTVGIVDGEFFQSLAVSPKEVLALLDRGIAVYGSSSMGALRAVETHLYGMQGIGKIFEWYRDGIIDADDEVALTYNPVTCKASSEPLVNIRFFLRKAVSEGVIGPSKADEIVETLKQVYFPLRSYHLVTQLCPELEGCPQKWNLDQKRDDALLLLRTIASAAD